MSTSLQFAASSHVGLVRRNNQDSFAIRPEHALAVVCDGMGGLAAGEVASRLAVDTFVREFASHPQAHPPELRMALAIRAANAAVYNEAPQRGTRRGGMGTTLVAAVISVRQLTVANVGDSRAHLLRHGECLQISQDHSYLAEVLRSGRVQEGELRESERQRFGSLVTRAIGSSEDVEPDFFSVTLEPGDRILLCSDGLTRYMDCHRLAQAKTQDLQALCDDLVAEANAAGGVDNITIVAMQLNEAPAGQV